MSIGAASGARTRPLPAALRVVSRHAKSQQAVVIAVVKAAGLVSRDGSHAVALVYADQVVVSGHGANGQPLSKVLLDRVRVSLDLVGEKWLVSGIDPT